MLALTAEVAVALTHKIIENKEYIFRNEYMGQQIYKVPSFGGANLAAYMLQFGDIVSATHDGMRREWRLDIMLDVKMFYSIPNWLNLEGRRLLTLRQDWSPFRNLPGEEGPEKARPEL